MNKLFSPYQIKNVTFKNRIVMSPMCMHSSVKEDGMVNPFHITHYASRATGQVGLIFLESTAVDPQGRISMTDLGIWDDEHVLGLKAIVDAVHENDSKVGIQLAHAGRKAIVRGPIIAPSPLPFPQEGMKVPQEMSVEDIRNAIKNFKDGARRSKEAGFDVIELHGAHGYLIHQFLSPLSNKRKDEYGGSLENRYRFLRELIDEVKSAWDGPLFVRISANEYHPEGNTVDDYIYFSQQMKAQGVDLIDVSSGAIVPNKVESFPGYQVPLAEKIRQGANIPTGAVGFIFYGAQAEDILRNERADLIFIARELLRNPYWALKAAAELGVSIPSPRQYGMAWNEILPKEVVLDSIGKRWVTGTETLAAYKEKAKV
jgi:NADPH2 dehydrogenase